MENIIDDSLKTKQKVKTIRVIFDENSNLSQEDYKKDNPNIPSELDQIEIIPVERKNINTEQSEPIEEDAGPSECSLKSSLIRLMQFINERNLGSKMNLGFILLFYCCCIIQSLNLFEELQKIGQYVEMGCQFMFIISLIKNITSCEKKQLPWIILDFITTGSGCAAFFINDEEAVRYLKAIRTLKLLFLIKFVENMKNPLLNCLRGLAKAGKILLPAIFLIYIYAVVGLFSFVDYEYNKCRNPGNKNLSKGWSVYEGEVFLCGNGRSCPVVSGVQYQCLNPVDYGVEPNSVELKNFAQGYGFQTFSNIGYAFFFTFKNIFLCGSTRFLVLYMHTLGAIFVATYFYSFIYLMPYIYLNIFYGLLISSISKNLEQQEKIQLMEEQQRGGRGQKRMKTFKVSVITHSSIFGKSEKKIFVFEKPVLEKIRAMPAKKFSMKIRQDETENKLKINNIFEADKISISEASQVSKQRVQKEEEERNLQRYEDYFSIRKIFTGFNVIFCFITLAIDYAKQPSQFEFILDAIDCILLLWLTIEIVIKISYELRYLDKITLFTKADICVMLVCICGMLYEAIVAESFYQFVETEDILTSLIRSVKYFRFLIWILQIDFFSQQDKEVFLCICKAIYAVRYFILVWFLIVNILAIMGFHLHHGKNLFDQNGNLDLQNGTPLQINLNGIYHSLIFTLLTVYDQQWDVFMFQQYPGCKTLIIIWQIIVIVVGFLLFSKYLMCLIVKQLDFILQQNQKIQTQAEQMQENEDDIEQKKQCQKSLTENNKHNSVKPYTNTRNSKSNNSSQPQVEPNPCVIRLKQLIRLAVDSFTFSVIKIITILVICITTAITNPTVSTLSTEVEVCRIVTGVCGFVFLFEFVGVIWVYGFWQDPENAYFTRNRLNYLNLLILTVEILTLTPLSQFHLFYRVEKLRALRSINLIDIKYYYDQNMKIIVRSMLKMIPRFFKLLTLLFIINYFFALIFNKWHKNDFYFCENVPDSATIIVKEDCLLWGGDWLLASFNCQTSLHSFFYMVIVVSMGGWVYLMQFTMNLNGEGNAPKYNQSQFNQIFFTMFFFIGNLILLNVFISLTLHNFKKLKDEETGFANITDSQKTWLGIKLQITRLETKKKKQPPKNLMRNLAYRFCRHPAFKILQSIFFILFLATLSATSTYQDSHARKELMRMKQAFALVTVVEYFIELLAFGFGRGKLKTIFQTISAVYSLIFSVISESPDISQQTERIIGAIFIILQILRYISLLDEIPFTSKILNTLLKILPRSINIFLILLLYLYLSAILGTELFAFLKPQRELDGIHQHYRNFPMALISLVKFSILESLTGQIQDSAHILSPNFICFNINSYEDFQQYGYNGCGNPVASYLFFFSFHMFYTIFLMSTFIAFIVDTYSDILREEESDITKHVLNKVSDLWCEIDPEGTGYINFRDFWLFTNKFMHIYKKQAPSSKEIDDLIQEKEKFMKRTNLTVYENENGVLSFQFHETIKALTRIYLQDYRGFRIREKEIENPFENELREKLGVKKTIYKSSDVQILLILKAGLKNWKHKAEGQIIFFQLPQLLQNRKTFLYANYKLE